VDWLTRLNNGPKALGDGLEVLHWSYSAALPDNVTHRHTYFEICLVGDRGAGIFTVEDKLYEIEAGDLFIARPGVVHRIQNHRQPHMELFWVSFSWTDESKNSECELWREFSASPILVRRDEGSIRNLWQTLRIFAESGEFIGKNSQLAAIEKALLLEIARYGAPNSEQSEAVAESDPHRTSRLAARYIHDNLTRKLVVEEIAAHVHISPRHLNRLFLKFSGVSPSQFIETTRLEKAAQLLRDSGRPIKEIAALCGYLSVYHFTRAFTRHTGIPPATFRRNEKTLPTASPKRGEFV
jgi:AraC-like DNA-binding protein